MSRIACVVIGRNEGDRLVRCLSSVLRECECVVYADSASTDGSLDAARRLGVATVALDGSERLSAARGRNAGFEHLSRTVPDLEYVQFLDGDSELIPGWLARGALELDRTPDAAAVCGRVRERNPERSVYNALYEMDWVHEPGDVEWLGGTALFRASAFREARGFDANLIAGEEPDLCARLRARGHRIRSVECDMSLHDANMTRFSEWWVRNVRTGHAYAEAMDLRPDDPAMASSEAIRSISLWAMWLPGLSIALAPPTLGASLLAPIGGYPALFARIYRSMRERGFSRKDASRYAAFCVLGKFPQAWGLARYQALRLRGRSSELIEYKGRA